jgi:hypothetical protein
VQWVCAEVSAVTSQGSCVIGPVLRVLLATLVVQVLLAALPSPAFAAEVCWKMLVNDYWADGRLDRTYSVSCFRDAIDKLPPDVRQYSDASDDLRRALAGAVRERTEADRGPPEPATPGPAPLDDKAPKGFFEESIDRVGPKNAESVPVQVLVLASLTLLLLASAGVSRLNEYLQARRSAGD